VLTQIELQKQMMGKGGVIKKKDAESEKGTDGQGGQAG
jgi:hypothetical protein